MLTAYEYFLECAWQFLLELIIYSVDQQFYW